MSQVLEGYQRQYCELSSNLLRKCTAASTTDGELKKQTISEIKAGIDGAEALFRKMDLEARSLPPNVKGVLLAKLREYKSDLNNLKSKITRLTLDYMDTREELLESGMAEILSRRSKNKANDVNRKIKPLHGQNQGKLKDHARDGGVFQSSKVSINSGSLSYMPITRSLEWQLYGVDENIGKSNRILTAMSRRMDRHKWIIGLIIAVLVVAIVVILYFKLKQQNHRC